MSCVAAIRDPKTGAIFMGGDSAATGTDDITIWDRPKVFRNGPLLIGCVGTFRAMDILQHKLQIPAHPGGIATRKYLASTLVEEVWGLIELERDVKKSGFDVLVAYQGELCVIQGDDYSVGFPASSYDAIGAGGDMARGALWLATHVKHPKPTRQRLLLALKAAEALCNSVRGPFTIRQLKLK